MSEERTPSGAEGELGGEDLDLDLNIEEGEPPEPLEPPETESGEDTTEGGEPSPPATQQRPGRRERQARELRDSRERIERLERELQRVTSQPPPAPPRIDPQEQARRDEQEFQAALANVPFEQQAAFSGRWWASKYAQQQQQQIQNTQLTVAQAIDKSTWDASCRLDQSRAAFATRVEDLYQSELRAGRAQSREVIYYYLLGQEADRQRATRTARQRREATGRVRAQTTQPVGARSDTARPSGRPTADSYEAALERIKGQPLW
jgi:hypothetical protein